MGRMAQTFDICIRGAGVVGRTLALLLARERLRVALVAGTGPASAATADVRAYALNAASRQLLEGLRSWPDATHATAVASMQVQGDQGGAVSFDAQAQGVDALAWIVDVPALETRLAEAVRYQPQVEMLSAPVDAALTVVCEGRASQTRTEFGVDFDVTPYGQHAAGGARRELRGRGLVCREGAGARIAGTGARGIHAAPGGGEPEGAGQLATGWRACLLAAAAGAG
jgi:2-polyprenyl-6-methoxyphenol hydroxylase-like FAD-dependent oxidoreductase